MPLGSQSIFLVLCPANVVTRPLPEQAPCYLSLGIPLIPCAPSTYASVKPFARMQKSGPCVDCRALKSPFLSSVLYSGERGLVEVRFSRSLHGCLGPFPAARGALGLSAQVPVRVLKSQLGTVAGRDLLSAEIQGPSWCVTSTVCKPGVWFLP